MAANTNVLKLCIALLTMPVSLNERKTLKCYPIKIFILQLNLFNYLLVGMNIWYCMYNTIIKKETDTKKRHKKQNGQYKKQRQKISQGQYKKKKRKNMVKSWS